MPQADIGLIGLAVMGQNLVLNMADKGFSVAVFNRTVSKVDDFKNGEAKSYDQIIACHSLEELAASLKRPRRVMLMVKAGKPVDEFIAALLPHLEPGDIIIDGGNSNFQDTVRRTKELEAKGFLYIGTGVSGGEEGARHGPSIMPGGSPAAWPHVKDIFQAISAKAGNNEPCCDWVGKGGAGHFVKMVHNGIEYGDMQLICEAYHMMSAMGLKPAEMSEIFAQWNKGELDSYLIEITRDILAKVDAETGKPVVDLILDTAGQKGTGKWTVITACDLGMPVTLIAEAVFSRCLSAIKEERVAASSKLTGPQPKFTGDRKTFIEDIRQALYASKIVSYAQGFQMMRAAAAEYGWPDLNYGAVAAMWRGGCIIRSRFLSHITDAFRQGEVVNLLTVPFFQQAVKAAQDSWRRVITAAVNMGIPVPAFSTALAYYDGYRCQRLPANLLQAQRDYFGAHTYERVDKERGQFFHTNWTGTGGSTTASTYVV